MRSYIGIVHKVGESAYGIHFPDVPGCFSAADTLADLLRNAAEALSLHLDDIAAPEARPLEQVRADPHMATELMAGVGVLAVPWFGLADGTKANIT